MTNKLKQDILPLVKQPSRYLGCEVNRTKKDLHGVKLRVALAFPDMYEIGTSHFGMQILYDQLNAHRDIAAERVFTPDVDMQVQLKANNLDLLSLESQWPLKQFDILGFSLLYELNYTNILAMLDLAGIPFYSADRDDKYPVIVAGGPCTANPEPVADFFDAMVVGDGEVVMPTLADSWLTWKKQPDRTKEGLLNHWQQIEGVYIPSFYETILNDNGLMQITSHKPGMHQVQRAVLPDLDGASFPESPVIPFGRPVHDRLRVEISRGCTRGCRFCQAGMIYRPVRDRSPERVLELTDLGLETTGYDDISLLSLSTGDYRCVGPLLEQLMRRHAKDHRAVSLPSLRADTLTPELVRLIKKVRKTGFTIAPEAGSQRLRDLINKEITHDDIEHTVRTVFDQGWEVIKLYFMIGLPTETQEDLAAIVDLVRHLKKIRPTKKGRRRPKINVSVTTFIPKAHTPFQWCPQLSLEKSKETIEWLKQQLTAPSVRFKWQNPEVSLVEGVFSRGDRRLSRLLVAAYDKGCRFDGWSDHFSFDKWQEAFRDVGLDSDLFTTRRRYLDEPLPWDHIDVRVTKNYLKKEWEKAKDGQITKDCRDGHCHQCGVCDFQKIEPVVFSTVANKAPQKSKRPQSLENRYVKWHLTYSKTGNARFFGHLEMVNIFMRAFRRANIPIKFSQGYHPKPKLSFTDPLPLGMESLNESLTIEGPENMAANQMARLLNDQLPDGLTVMKMAPANGKKMSIASTICYRVFLGQGVFNADDREAFMAETSWIFKRKTSKGKVVRVDARPLIEKLSLTGDKEMTICMQTKSGTSLRPAEMLKNVFALSETDIKQARIVKQ